MQQQQQQALLDAQQQHYASMAAAGANPPGAQGMMWSPAVSLQAWGSPLPPAQLGADPHQAANQPRQRQHGFDVGTS